MTNPDRPDDPQQGPLRPPWAWEDPTLANSWGSDVVAELPPRQHMERRPRVQSALEAAPISRLSILATALVIGAILGGAGGYFAASSGKSSSAVVPKATHTATAPISYIVTGKGDQSIVAIRSDTGQSVLIATTSKTSFERAGLPDTFDDLSIGLQITLTGQTITSTNIDADSIQVQDTRLSGQIQSIDSTGDTRLTIVSGAKQFTISLTAHTKFVDYLTHQVLDRTALQVGKQIRAYGSISPTGPLAAAIIMIQQ